MSTRTLVSKLSHLLAAARSPSLHCSRPIVAAGEGVIRWSVAASVSGGGIRSFSSRLTTSSPNYPSLIDRLQKDCLLFERPPDASDLPLALDFDQLPDEDIVDDIMNDLFDLEHWVVTMELPEPHLTRDEIIDSYIKTLAQVVGSEQEARSKLYAVSTDVEPSFRALISKELAIKITTLPKVYGVYPDVYVDPNNKDFFGEPFMSEEEDGDEWWKHLMRCEARIHCHIGRTYELMKQRECMQNHRRHVMHGQMLQSWSNRPLPMANQALQSGPNQPQHGGTITSDAQP